MPNHILRDRHVMIDLPIMHLEFQAHKIRQDGCGAGLGFDGGCALAWWRSDDGEAVDEWEY